MLVRRGVIGPQQRCYSAAVILQQCRVDLNDIFLHLFSALTATALDSDECQWQSPVMSFVNKMACKDSTVTIYNTVTV